MPRPCSSCRAAVVSGRWEEILEHTREAMARGPANRLALMSRRQCLADLKAMEDEDDGIDATINKETL